MKNILFERLAKHAAQQPHKIALRDESGALTYAELLSALNTRMQQFKGASYQRVANALPNNIDWVICDLALYFNRAVSIPIPPFFTPEQQRKLLQDSGAQWLLTSIGNDIEALPLKPLTLPDLPEGTVKITYTSGSTSEPKGVCLGCDNIQNTIAALDQRIGHINVQRHLCVMPLAVLLENIAGVYLGLWRGYEIILARTELQYLIDNLSRYQPQSVIATPGLVSAMIRAVEHEQLNPSWLALIAVGGARLLPVIEQRAAQLKLPVVQGYGLSEFGSVACFNQPNQSNPLGSVGQPLKHTQLAIKNGEIVIRGNAMLGYVHDRTSWYPESIYTGDWGFVDSHGYVYVNGRKKHTMVTPFGRNVDPEWLEAELIFEAEISQAAVFGGEELPITALIFGHADRAQVAAAVHRVNQRLPDYAHISHWHYLTEPFTVGNRQLTGTGRIRRQHIAVHYAELLQN